MGCLRDRDTRVTLDWSDLVDELDCWGEAGRVAALWWRDDDAIAATPQLAALLRLAGPVPVALAVIPALARPDLAMALASASQVAVLQHGWQHANRAQHGKKSEYPDGRSATVVATELGAGRARLTALFGGQALPVFVPPWNRLAAQFLPLLVNNGLAAVSAIARRPAALLPAGLAALDVHLDLVAWRGDRGFIGAAAALGGLVGHLRAARLGTERPAGPIGILTHHLIMDGATAAFVERLLALTGAHGAVRWTATAELL
jgi:hypothetical protein